MFVLPFASNKFSDVARMSCCVLEHVYGNDNYTPPPPNHHPHPSPHLTLADPPHHHHYPNPGGGVYVSSPERMFKPTCLNKLNTKGPRREA